MGLGDEIMASGLAKGLHAKGKRAAFGDGKHIIWGPWSEEIFRYNPNVAHPGDERSDDLVWIDHYKGKRWYNRLDKAAGRWIWNYDFKATPGEIYFREPMPKNHGFIYIEPNVPWKKSVAPNKYWGLEKFQAVATLLCKAGFQVVQSNYGRDKLTGVKIVDTPSFRHALAFLSRARVALWPEGGLHHGAAALAIPAVVLFGGFIPPAVTGYSDHVNLTGGVEPCGNFKPCQHCRAAMARISVEEVYESILAQASVRDTLAG